MGLKIVTAIVHNGMASFKTWSRCTHILNFCPLRQRIALPTSLRREGMPNKLQFGSAVCRSETAAKGHFGSEKLHLTI
jgi:hypothetical protein